MEDLILIIEEILNTTSINWLILSEISSKNYENKSIKIDFGNNIYEEREAFGKNQGHLIFESPECAKKILGEIIKLAIKFNQNTIALANLFIIISRVSCNDDDKLDIVNEFKNILGKDACEKIFNSLIASLNNEYFKNIIRNLQLPLDIDRWLELFHSVQYMHTFSDPVLFCLQLMYDGDISSIDFDFVENMKPILRSLLMGWHGFDLEISSEKAKVLYGNQDEMIFLAACLIDDYSANKKPKNWLSEDIMGVFVNRFWEKIGKKIFTAIFGINYRNKSKNEVYKKMEDLMYAILSQKISEEPEQYIGWVSSFKFPEDFIAFFSMVDKKEYNFNQVPEFFKIALTNQFIAELNYISSNIPEYLAEENNKDPFLSFQLVDEQYDITLTYLLFILLSSPENQLKKIKNVSFDFKMLFYGGYQARSLAAHYFELMLLIGLSGINMQELPLIYLKSIENYLKSIIYPSLVSYVHLVERNNDIWDSERTENSSYSSSGRRLISNALTRIKHHPIYPVYESLFKKIEDIKISEWPYERQISF